jgi:hypothetical protein
MTMQRAILICFLLCLFLLLPTWGDPTDETPLGACYMGYGKMLEAAKSRQLSLNAHVQQFLYQPGGLGIAYQGMEKNGDELTQFIRLVGVNRGTVTNLVSTTSQVGEDADKGVTSEAPYGLAGWSGDGRYLLLNQDAFVTPAEGDSYISENFTCVDVGILPPHLVSIPLPQPDRTDKGVLLLALQWWWSPDRTQILFALPEVVKADDHRAPREDYCRIYNLKTGDLQMVTLPDRQVIRGWLDGKNLLVDDSRALYEHQPDAKAGYASYDIKAGTQAAIPTPKAMPTLPNGLDRAPSAVSPKAAYMRLDDEVHHIQDQQKLGAIDAHALWIRRTQGPKLMSTAPVGLTPGADDPQAAWSPTGAQIAFIAHGDLFVTDLTMRDATAIEKYKAGETLTCEEERDLAASNLQQIGLGLLQYCQDFDEKFPPADQWQDKIKPYLGTDTLFSVGNHPVVYQPPADLSLAHLDNMADRIIATMDLPCASLALMADGHVRVFKDKAAEKQFVDSQK